MDLDHKPATLRDVARLAGVHPATASRALSGSRNVNPELARQVRKAARSLDYRVNSVGRALKRRTTGVIGMAVPDLTNPFFPDLIRSIERALSAESRALFLCDSDNSVEGERTRLEILTTQQVDGVIISPVHAIDSQPALEAALTRVPVVQVDRLVENVALDAVVGDQRRMTADLVRHLRARGCKSFCMIASGEAIYPVAERLEAYLDLMADDPESRMNVLRGDLSGAWGAAACQQLLETGKPLPDAIVCVNDLTAVGAIEVLRAAGISIPDDVRVVGFDNTPLAGATGLTTVQQPIHQMGVEALQMLAARTAHRSGPTRRLTLEGTLIVRESG